jgi:hypothetical protein
LLLKQRIIYTFWSDQTRSLKVKASSTELTKSQSRSWAHRTQSGSTSTKCRKCKEMS